MLTICPLKRRFDFDSIPGSLTAPCISHTPCRPRTRSPSRTPPGCTPSAQTPPARPRRGREGRRSASRPPRSRCWKSLYNIRDKSSFFATFWRIPYLESNSLSQLSSSVTFFSSLSSSSSSSSSPSALLPSFSLSSSSSSSVAFITFGGILNYEVYFWQFVGIAMCTCTDWMCTRSKDHELIVKSIF